MVSFQRSISSDLMAASSSSSSSCNWSHDVFISFSEEDVGKTLVSHLLSAFDRKLISVFKDYEVERTQSLSTKHEHAIRDSRIAIVIFSEHYASRSCLDDFLKIMKRREEFAQPVIPVFYRLDPYDIRKRSGEFGTVFEESCKNSTDDEINQWKLQLTSAAKIVGNHSCNWNDEAKGIEEIADDVLGKLLLTPCKDFDDIVGIDDHIAKMILLLCLESEEARMVGIWGPSGIGKTTIARALFSRLSHQFQSSIYIDSAFISKCMKRYRRANPDDCNLKLHLQRSFLSKFLNRKEPNFDHLGMVQEKLNHMKVLIVFDDLDDQVVVDALAGQTLWFGGGSRIIVVTKDKHILRAHKIHHIYKVGFPSGELARDIFCQSAFGQTSPPNGFDKFASEVAVLAGGLPLGLKVLGSYIRVKDKNEWMGMLPSLRKKLNGTIEKTLKVGYDGLGSKEDKAIFRLIACLFNGARMKDIQQLLANSDLDVNIGLKNLVDKSLIHVRGKTVEMPRLLQEMGKEIVNTQSSEPGKREFLVNPKDICDVLEDNTGTKKVLGISLDIEEIDELDVHEGSFREMCNLHFLKFHAKTWKSPKEVKLHLPEKFDYFTSELRLLCWDRYPAKCMPSQFCPENLVNLRMQDSDLENLWEGVVPLACLKQMDLQGSKNLKQISDLSMATNLERLIITDCWSLEELPSMKNLNKLTKLSMARCKSLKALPIGINLESLTLLDLRGCSGLSNFPNISTKISELYLCDSGIQELPSNTSLDNPVDLHTQGNKSDEKDALQLPSSLAYPHELKSLTMKGCKIETFPTGINFESLNFLNLSGCSRLRDFPNISKEISTLYLSQTAIKEVPSWIESFTKLKVLYMSYCKKLKYISPNISKLKHLNKIDFSNCGALTEHDWLEGPSGVAMEAENNAHTKLAVSEEASSSVLAINSFKSGQQAMVQKETVLEYLILPGGEVPSYFTNQTTGSSLLQIPLSKQLLFGFRACVVLVAESMPGDVCSFKIQVQCCFRDRHGKHFEFADHQNSYPCLRKGTSHLFIFDCHFPLDKKKAPVMDLEYDQVDIEFNVSSQLKIKKCGVRFSEDRPSTRLFRRYLLTRKSHKQAVTRKPIQLAKVMSNKGL